MSIARSEAVAPARGTRPRNRRNLILSAATELFYRRGYEHVSTSEIAEAVGIGPSALYRHFTSKQQLLAAVVFEGFQPAKSLIEDLDLTDFDGSLDRLTGLALDQRRIGVLWDRDARNMTEEDRVALRSDVTGFIHRISALVNAERSDVSPASADLQASALLALLMSPSFHHLELTRSEYSALLRSMARSIVDMPIQDFDGRRRPHIDNPLVPWSRREAILGEASRLFAAHGYGSVSLEDIGASLGIAGPSVYNHFGSKVEILALSLNRGTAMLMMDLHRILESTVEPAEILEGLIDSYLQLATHHYYVLDLLITEVGQLPEDQRLDLRQTQRDYIGQWARVLELMYPDIESTVARIKVQAVLTVINDTARTPHLRHARGYHAALRTISRRLLLGRD